LCARKIARIRRFQQMSSGAFAVVGMTRLPARLECVGLKGRRLCVCVAPCCRQAAGPHTHTPYSHATSLKIARLQCARAAHGVRKWVIRVGDMYIYIFFSFPRSRSLAFSLTRTYTHTHSSISLTFSLSPSVSIFPTAFSSTRG